MKLRIQNLGVLLTGLLAATSLLHGAGNRYAISLDKAVESADLIGVGTLHQVKDDPGQDLNGSWTIYRGRLAVQQVLKGLPKDPVTVRFTKFHSKIEYGEFPPQEFTEGHSGIWLLYWNDSDRYYGLVDPYENGCRPVKDLEEVRKKLAGQVAKLAHGPGVPSKGMDLGFSWRFDPLKLIVASVKPSSPAAEGKFQADDEIESVEAQAVVSPQDFDDRVLEFTSGSKLKVKVKRRAGDGLQPFSVWLVRPEGVGKEPPMVDHVGQPLLSKDAMRRKAEAYAETDPDLKGRTIYSMYPLRRGGMAIVRLTGGFDPSQYVWWVGYGPKPDEPSYTGRARTFDMRTGALNLLPVSGKE